MIIVPMFIYSLPTIIYSLSDNGYRLQIKELLFISHSQYWYMRTYIGLFLLSPIINKYLDACTKRSRFALLISLLFIATWGGISYGDPSLYAGKNIINFMLFYAIGDTFRRYNYQISKISIRLLLPAYLLLNILLVGTFSISSNSSLSQAIYRLSYQYCSPILLINSILVFFIFTKISFTSSIINYAAKSVLATYLIHCNNVIFSTVIAPIVILLFNEGNPFLNFLGLLMLTISIYLVCLIVDKSLAPVWILTEKTAIIIDKKAKIEYC